MGKIKNIPLAERPRERAIRHGVSNLSNQELIAIIISSGTKGQSALEIANDLLDKTNGMHNLIKIHFEDLLTIKGINRVKAITILTVIEILRRIERLKIEEKQSITCSQDVYDMLKFKYADYQKEEVTLILLNGFNRVIKEEIICVGGINCVSIDYRLIIAKLLKSNCTKCIIVHNHPNTSSNPSVEDIDVTLSLKKKLETFAIKILDHIIIAQDDYYSFKDNDIL